MVGARASDIRPQTSIASPGRARSSPAGTARRVCTAGRASFMTGRIPIRSALSVVVVPADENGLTKDTPTIAEFFKANGYSTYYSGKWHLGDQPKFYPHRTRLRRDEGIRRLLSRRLYLRRHKLVCASLVPEI